MILRNRIVPCSIKEVIPTLRYSTRNSSYVIKNFTLQAGKRCSSSFPVTTSQESTTHFSFAKESLNPEFSRNFFEIKNLAKKYWNSNIQLKSNLRMKHRLQSIHPSAYYLNYNPKWENNSVRESDKAFQTSSRNSSFGLLLSHLISPQQHFLNNLSASKSYYCPLNQFSMKRCMSTNYQSNEFQEKSSEEHDSEDSKKEASSHNKGIRGAIRGYIDSLKADMKTYPESYSAPNFVLLILFTIFCLMESASSDEVEWWLRTFGINADFSPLAWIFHSFLTTNSGAFLFELIAMYTYSLAVFPLFKPGQFFPFTIAVATLSGAFIWGYNFYKGTKSERQYGPWDILTSYWMFYYIRTGNSPFLIAFSAASWVKILYVIGIPCLLFYSPQSIMAGIMSTLLLAKRF